MRTMVKALESKLCGSHRAFVLLIEEINRANVAAVFGDVFQLLDRNDDNASEYPIQASEDMKKYLSDNLGGQPDDYSQIRIPDNMFIWATMNSADQGVFPMDTAFKRRWDFKYIGINENDEIIQDKEVEIVDGKFINWNELRKSINDFLASKNINEDKQLGPYFIAKKIVVPKNGKIIEKNKFREAFKNKVIMYLFEDAGRQKRNEIFAGCQKDRNRYSEICMDFDKRGIEIFNEKIVQKFKTNIEENSDNFISKGESKE